MTAPKISSDDVKHVASLARLGLSKAEIEQVAQDLANILDHFALIQDIDTTNTPTSDDVTGRVNVVRQDQADPECLCTTDQLLNRAPATKDQQFKVPGVFDEPSAP